MKTCTILGDMTSDSAADNYPVVQICDACHLADANREEDSQIVTTQNYDPTFGDSCEFCDKTYEEELAEK